MELGSKNSVSRHMSEEVMLLKGRCALLSLGSNITRHCCFVALMFYLALPPSINRVAGSDMLFAKLNQWHSSCIGLEWEQTAQFSLLRVYNWEQTAQFCKFLQITWFCSLLSSAAPYFCLHITIGKKKKIRVE